MEQKQVFRITAVEVRYEKGIGGGTYGPFINTSTVALEFATIEDCKKVIEIAGLKDWSISKCDAGSWHTAFGNDVEKSKGYQEALDIIERNRKEEREAKEKRVKAINSLPKRFELDYALPEGVKIWFERSEAEYNPKYSGRIQWGVHCYYLTKVRRRETKPENFWISTYVAADKKILRKKFARDANWMFGEDISKSINLPELIETVINSYNTIVKRIGETS